MVWSAKESLSPSPGERLTTVLGPGGFGKGGCEVWQPPHVSAAKTRKAKRQEEKLNLRLREAVSVPGNCRSSHVCLLFCVMQRCLLYKIVDRQDKCDKVGNQGPEGRKCRPSPERLAEVRGVDQIPSMLAAGPSGGPDPPRRPGLQIGHAGRAVAVAVFPGTQIFNLQLYPNELRLQRALIFLAPRPSPASENNSRIPSGNSGLNSSR